VGVGGGGFFVQGGIELPLDEKRAKMLLLSGFRRIQVWTPLGIQKHATLFVEGSLKLFLEGGVRMIPGCDAQRADKTTALG